MKLTYEDKLKIIELYKDGYGARRIAKELNVNPTTVKATIKRFKIHGLEALNHGSNKSLSADIKLEIINKRKVGVSLMDLETEYLVSAPQIYTWIKKYDEFGYNGLNQDKRGRPPKMPNKEVKVNKPKPLEKSEREELIRLRAENKQLEMENHLLKKLKALVLQRNPQSRKKK